MSSLCCSDSPWADYFMGMAYHAATMSTCVRRRVGAIAVKLDGKRIVATGYNGAPPHLEHCTQDTCLRTKLNIPSGEALHLCRAVHAEENLLIQAARFGISLQGCVVYCTTAPCFTCAKHLYSVGIDTVFYKESYPDKMCKDFCDECGLHLIQYP